MWGHFNTHQLIQRYKLVHTHENLNHLSYFQRQSILRTQTVTQCTKDMLMHVRFLVKMAGYEEINHLLNTPLCEKDVHLFLTTYLSVLHTNHILPFITTNTTHRKMYDLALDILLRWNEILDTMSIRSELVVPFFINLHTYTREFPICLQETRKARMPEYQRLLFNYSLAPNPNPVFVAELTQFICKNGGQEALDPVEAAIRIASGLPTIGRN